MAKTKKQKMAPATLYTYLQQFTLKERREYNDAMDARRASGDDSPADEIRLALKKSDKFKAWKKELKKNPVTLKSVNGLLGYDSKGKPVFRGDKARGSQSDTIKYDKYDAMAKDSKLRGFMPGYEEQAGEALDTPAKRWAFQNRHEVEDYKFTQYRVTAGEPFAGVDQTGAARVQPINPYGESENNYSKFSRSGTGDAESYGNKLRNYYNDVTRGKYKTSRAYSDNFRSHASGWLSDNPKQAATEAPARAASTKAQAAPPPHPGLAMSAVGSTSTPSIATPKETTRKVLPRVSARMKQKASNRSAGIRT